MDTLGIAAVVSPIYNSATVITLYEFARAANILAEFTECQSCYSRLRVLMDDRVFSGKRYLIIGRAPDILNFALELEET